MGSLEALVRDWPGAAELSAQPGAFAAALAESAAADRVGPVKTVGDRAARAGPGAAPIDLADGSQDLIVSLMSLHWANDLPGALSQIRRALKPDGLFLGTLLGAGTLKELRAVLTEAELEARGGAEARVSPFADGFDGAALLQRAGFALPVADVDRVTVRYPDLLALFRDLRAMGETNAVLERRRVPTRRDVLLRAAALYAERFADPRGRIVASFQVITMTAWAPHASQQKPLRPGSASARLADALHTREVGLNDPVQKPAKPS